ncbi:type I-C CRISPR-associated protein Cas8c/Csd1 [Acetivibrio sp. MSJd-27]|nr:type I-C CRISPR-associated protein Cas8c/Csd1 [Acetivibrio sp. MSJd-27]
MSWMSDLCQTYDACFGKKLTFQPRTELLHMGHSTQNAQIEIVLNGDGLFRNAEIVPKDDAVTVIPVTEDSAGKTSGDSPHPLCDKLKYIAADYAVYTKEDNAKKYNAYLEQLKDWAESPYSCQKVQAIYTYLKKGRVITDLLEAGILQIGENGKLKDDKIEEISQKDSFVRFRVEIDSGKAEDREARVYRDSMVYESFLSYYTSKKAVQKKDLCYATGKWMPCSDKHLAKIRHIGDKAKLISSNEPTGFTYHGRFSNSREVASIGYETSQKAHLALRWLVENQGFHCGEQVIVAWELQGRKIPSPFQGTAEVAMEEWEKDAEEELHEIVQTGWEFSKKLKKAVKGYRKELDIHSDVVVMALEAATTGRLSIVFYKKMKGSDYLDNIEHWHNTCSWYLEYKSEKQGDENSKGYFFVGAPSLRDICVTAYGDEHGESMKKLLKSQIERLLPCVTDRKPLPEDILRMAVNRIFRLGVFGKKKEEAKNKFQKALSITCAMIRKFRFDKYKEEWNMALEERRTDRSYLFGRLLAVAQELEENALYHQKNQENQKNQRDTAAERFREIFRRKPVKTWGVIEDCLSPYLSYQKATGNSLYTDKLDEIIDLFQPGDFESKAPLDELVFLGYHCQRRAFKEARMQNKQENKEKKGSIEE